MSLDGADPVCEFDDWKTIVEWAERREDGQWEDGESSVSEPPKKKAQRDNDIDGEPMDDDDKMFQNYATDSEDSPSEKRPKSASPMATHTAPRMSAEEREKMRKVELKVMQYQVELESHGFDKEYIDEKCALRRKRMLVEMEKSDNSSDDERDRRKSASKIPRESKHEKKSDNSSDDERNRRKSATKVPKESKNEKKTHAP